MGNSRSIKLIQEAKYKQKMQRQVESDFKRKYGALGAQSITIEAPWNQGGNDKVGCFFNKNTRYCLANVNDMWKVDHQFHPRRVGEFGYNANNQERPSRLYYQQKGKLFTQRSSPRKSSKSKSYSKTVVHDNTSDSRMIVELQSLRDTLKKRELNDIEDRIKMMQ
jgi:hypothetical protein